MCTSHTVAHRDVVLSFLRPCSINFPPQRAPLVARLRAQLHIDGAGSGRSQVIFHHRVCIGVASEIMVIVDRVHKMHLTALRVGVVHKSVRGHPLVAVCTSLRCDTADVIQHSKIRLKSHRHVCYVQHFVFKRICA